MLFLLPGFQNFAPTGQGNVRIEMVTGAPNRKKKISLTFPNNKSVESSRVYTLNDDNSLFSYVKNNCLLVFFSSFHKDLQGDMNESWGEHVTIVETLPVNNLLG